MKLHYGFVQFLVDERIRHVLIPITIQPAKYKFSARAELIMIFQF